MKTTKPQVTCDAIITSGGRDPYFVVWAYERDKRRHVLDGHGKHFARITNSVQDRRVWVVCRKAVGGQIVEVANGRCKTVYQAKRVAAHVMVALDGGRVV